MTKIKLTACLNIKCAEAQNHTKDCSAYGRDYPSKLTKAQENRVLIACKGEVPEDTLDDILDCVAKELATQKKEIIEKLKKMQDKSQSSASLIWNNILEQVIKIIYDKN